MAVIGQAPAGQQIVTLDELYRKYGEATMQLKQSNFIVMQLEAQLQQVLSGQAPQA